MDYMNGLAVYYAWATLHRLDIVEGAKPRRIGLQGDRMHRERGRLKRGVRHLAKLAARYT